MTQILVIEDDALVCTLMLKLLKAEAFEILIANDGATGVQLAQMYEPDLIICDVMMPEFDGYEVLRQLRDQPATATIPFIFLSAKADRTDLRQGMELGADDYLTKPFKRAELLGAIAARLEKRDTLTQPYIREMKRAASMLGQMAYVDPLTNLPNRISFHNQCQNAIQQAQEAGYSVAVMHLNLKDFGAVNTALGYFNGDRLLQKVATRLKRAVGESDAVARLVANEFGVLLNQVSDEVGNERTIDNLVQNLLASLTEPYELDEQSVQIQVRMGIAFYPEHGSSPDQLFDHAEIALRYAKAQNNQYQLYSPELAVLEAEKQLMQSQLALALERQEFQVYYQPQVNLITGRIIGAEALLRWNHPTHGLINPDVFLANAEDPATELAIGRWALETACRQATVWQSAMALPLRLAINVSAHQFQQENLVTTVTNTLQQTGLSADVLVLELTEACAMSAVELTVLKLKELKAIGVQIALDDFGTGFSSLNYLKRFPLDSLKIDKSFIQNMMTDTDDAAIAKMIIAVGQSLQLKVIAEGVETVAQFNFLRQSGCHAMQGSLFSTPLSGTELQELLAADKRFDPGAAKD
ncbi:EAL domain-containing protein [Leptolyngbya sp. FACHB-321]|uniref:putative bifunctional diguanylate cyclase/phosphodiesterase n=1 Tax=Leptolyngbya sp. FACHB-321 TaxID=2692807 RepID=UPI001681FD08|nr:EAL domain-containing response regulator [Leptolyngbya sp. FACHB-321]MBD2037934.1 EAL domain-containing protein [Leptolyngbya sp. FACHB-321]